MKDTDCDARTVIKRKEKIRSQNNVHTHSNAFPRRPDDCFD